MKRFAAALAAAVRAACLTSLIAVAAPAMADSDIPGYPQDIGAYDPREVAMLPNYCRYTQAFRDHVPGGHNQAEMDYWYAALGPSFHNLHHYCWGLMKTNRAMLLARSQQAKHFYLKSSIVEFDYVLDRAPANFLLRPEILTRKGENLIRIDRAPAGVLELQRAIADKPDYWPPYAVLADYYKDAGNTAKARQMLEQGLAAVPNAVALKRRLAELSGKEARVVRQP